MDTVHSPCPRPLHTNNSTPCTYSSCSDPTAPCMSVYLLLFASRSLGSRFARPRVVLSTHTREVDYSWRIGHNKSVCGFNMNKMILFSVCIFFHTVYVIILQYFPDYKPLLFSPRALNHATYTKMRIFYGFFFSRQFRYIKKNIYGTKSFCVPVYLVNLKLDIGGLDSGASYICKCTNVDATVLVLLTWC